MNALDMLQLPCVYTVERQDGRAPRVFKACAFPLWSGLHDLLNIYFPGWTSCKCEMPDLGCETTIYSVKIPLEARQ